MEKSRPDANGSWTRPGKIPITSRKEFIWKRKQRNPFDKLVECWAQHIFPLAIAELQTLTGRAALISENDTHLPAHIITNECSSILEKYTMEKYTKTKSDSYQKIMEEVSIACAIVLCAISKYCHSISENKVIADACESCENLFPKEVEVEIEKFRKKLSERSLDETPPPKNKGDKKKKGPKNK